MMNENDELLMSQLADGELSSDQANELLLGVLDAPAQREKLKELLRLRQATIGWRTREPQRPVMVVSDRPRSYRHGRFAWRVGNLAVAACVGGLLVLAGVWAAGWMGSPANPKDSNVVFNRCFGAPAVTPEQMQQVAKVFALHESVAGPLAWYAADDENIRLASAGETGAGHQPIAVRLRISPGGAASVARTLVIVCREQQSALIELPSESADRAGLRVYLTPRTTNGKLNVQYAIAVEGESPGAAIASLSGQQRVGLTETSLGQLALGDRVLNVEAAAWPIRQERN